MRIPSRIGDLEALDYDLDDLEQSAMYGNPDAQQILDSIQNEGLGGYAYEMMYLSFRVKPEPHLVGDDLDWFIKSQLEPKRERLRELFEPSMDDEMAFRRAWDVFHNYERYGFPHEGGYLDQPAEWLIVHNCAKTAHERAESLTSREEAWFHREKANQPPD